MGHILRLRPHHFLCIHGFRGKGYSPEYVKNFWSVTEKLQAPDVMIEVTEAADHICEPCPHKRGTGCASDQKIQQLDAAYKQALSIRGGMRVSGKQATELVTTKVSLEDFDRHCAPCEWKSLGYCRSALESLKKNAGLLIFTMLFSFFIVECVTPLSVWARHNKRSHRKIAVAAEVMGPPEPKSVEEVAESFEKPSDDVVSVQELVEKLEKKKKIDFKPMQQAVQLIEKQRYGDALVQLQKISRISNFSDYYHYLSGVAEFGRMKQIIRAGKLGALSSGLRAQKHFQEIASSPYSSLVRKTTAIRGEVEIELAEIYARTKKPSQAVTFFENGFEHLAQNRLLVLTPQRSIITYAMICDKKPTEICQTWIGKLVGFIDKPEEAKLLQRIAANKQLAPPKKTVPQYNVALDVQAYAKGYFQYIAGDYNGALNTWYQLLKDYPQSNLKFRTKFWMGRIAQKTKHPVQAQTLFREVIRDAPFSYYALLSSWFSDVDLSRNISAELPKATAHAGQLSPRGIVHLRKAEELVVNGLPSLARYELKEIGPYEQLPTDFLVYLALLNHKAENHRSVFQIYGELFNRGYKGMFSSFGEKLVFPAALYEKIKPIAQTNNIDPVIVLSIIKQESAFDHEAVSISNAYGLMQIIKPTARELESGVTVAELFDQKHNIELGSKYIAALLQRYEGNLALALAAYNAGPHNADRWKRDISSNLPMEEYIELITYKETREYVQNIVKNVYWYTRILRGEVYPNISAVVKIDSNKVKELYKNSTAVRFKKKNRAVAGAKNGAGESKR